MKTLIVIGLLFSTLFSADFRGSGRVTLNGGNTGDAMDMRTSSSVTGFIKYKYRLYSMVGEPVDILTAQWSISSVSFDSIAGVEGKNLTYGLCKGKENDSCIPASVMQSARISKLKLIGRGTSFLVSAGYSYKFDAGVMKAPGLNNEYGTMSFSTPASPSWEKAFFWENRFGKYVDGEEAKDIMKQKTEDLFSEFHVGEINYNLGDIRRYIGKRVKDKLDAEEAKKKAEEERLRLEKERLESEARAREAKEADDEYNRLMAEEKDANANRVTSAQNKLRDIELRNAQRAKERRDAHLAQLERDRRDRVKKEAERQARAEMESQRERERLTREERERERAEREAQRRVASSKDVFVDSSTGLMWQDIDLSPTGIGYEDGYYKNMPDWNDAKRYCLTLTLAGYTDWFMPSFKMSKTLIRKISRFKFGNYMEFWTSSIAKSRTGYDVWNVEYVDCFENTNVCMEGDWFYNRNYVRCVRKIK